MLKKFTSKMELFRWLCLNPYFNGTCSKSYNDGTETTKKVSKS